MSEDRNGVPYDRDKNEYLTNPAAAGRRRREVQAYVKRQSDCANEIVDAVLNQVDLPSGFKLGGRRPVALDAVRELIVRYHEAEEEADG